MSVRVMTWVWEHSPATGNDRLVLLALADCCDDTGRNAYPSLDTLAHKARVSRRTAIRCVQNLNELGAIEVVRNGGRKGRGGVSNGYRVVMDAAASGDSVAPLDDPKKCQRGTGDNLALVTPRTEVVTNRVESGDTGVTRTVEPKNRPKSVAPFSDDFDEVYAIYPKKGDRKAAYRAYVARRRAGHSHEVILRGTRTYAASRRGQDVKYTKKAATWFGPDEHFLEWQNGDPTLTPVAHDPDDPYAGVVFR